MFFIEFKLVANYNVITAGVQTFVHSYKNHFLKLLTAIVFAMVTMAANQIVKRINFIFKNMIKFKIKIQENFHSAGKI